MTMINNATSPALPQIETPKHQDISDKILLMQVPQEVRANLQSAQGAFQERMGDLQQQLKTETDPKRTLQLENEISNLKSSFEDFSNKMSLMGKAERLNSIPLLNARADVDFKAAITEFRSELIESYDRIGMADVKLEKLFACPVAADDGAGPPEKAGDAAGSAGAGASGAGEAGGADKTGDHKFIGMTPDQLVNTMEKDQSAFYAELKNMGVEDRQLVMQQVQNHLQQINQMFSMLSQMSQAMHDTAKAVISNLRV
ncbi:MAG: hypothetical protein ACNA8W_13425 [Bradymonadaceae bacterium]